MLPLEPPKWGQKDPLNNFSRKFWLALFILLVLAAIILVYALRQTGDEHQNQFSGTIQAAEINLTFGLGGTIAAVNVQEGQRVQAGEILMQLEADTRLAELARAQAFLSQAESKARLIAASPLAETQQVAVSNARFDLLQAQQELQALFENAAFEQARVRQALEAAENNLHDVLNSNLQKAITFTAVARAEKKLDSAHRDLTILTTPPSQAAIEQAYANQLLAEQMMDDTLADLALAQQKLAGGLGPYVPQKFVDDYKKQMRRLIQSLEIRLSQDQLRVQQARTKYQNLLTPVDEVELALAKAALARAEAELGQAQRAYKRVKDGPSTAEIAVLEAEITNLKREYEALSYGPDPDNLALSQARVASAAANLALAEANTIHEQLAAAWAEVDTARAAIGVIQAQINNLVLQAPVDGVVLQCWMEPGEIARPGITVITLGLLDEIKLVLFLPEAQYRDLRIGDEVTVRVDSLAGHNFAAVVSEIAAETDSIPRNVKSADGRADPVFRVAFIVRDPNNVLRPGMQAEVLLEQR